VFDCQCVCRCATALLACQAILLVGAEACTAEVTPPLSPPIVEAVAVAVAVAAAAAAAQSLQLRCH